MEAREEVANRICHCERASMLYLEHRHPTELKARFHFKEILLAIVGGTVREASSLENQCRKIRKASEGEVFLYKGSFNGFLVQE